MARDQGGASALSSLPFVPDDGGRAAAGFRGSAGDCVARAIAITTGRPYREVYDRLAAGMGAQRRSKRQVRKGQRQAASAREGVSTSRAWFRAYMAELGFTWQPAMGIGTGCQVHLRAGEVPEGRCIAVVSRHYVALVGGVIRDTHDPSRGGARCVYGFWRLES